MIVEADFVRESHFTEGAFVGEAIVKMLCFNMILSTGHNFVRVSTKCTMVFSINIALFEELNELFRIRNSGP